MNTTTKGQQMTSWTPHEYQVHAAQHALYNAGAALFLEPGLGKTSIALATVMTLRNENVIRAALVIAPLRVCYSVWPRETGKWSEFAGMSVGVLHGKNKDAVLNEKHDVYVINPEGLKWLVAALAKREMPFDMLIVDESTKFKHTNTERFKTLKSMLPSFKRRLILTGTPVANRLEDIFGQMYIVDDGQRLGRFVTHFRRAYFDEHRNPWLGFSEWFPRADTAERIRAKVQDVAYYLKTEDVLTMPKRIDNRIEVTLPASASALYAKVERDFFATIGDATISAAQASAVQMKLRQMVGGHVYTDTGVEALHTAKLDALIDLIDEASGEPVLVAVNFLHEAEALQAALKREFNLDVPYIGDGISAKKSDEIAVQWNAGKLPVLLANPASVAHGLNLQAGGHTVVWYTLTWSLEDYDQFNRRVYRQGQDKAVIIHHIIAAGTVDEDVLAALQSKDTTQKGFLHALKEKRQAAAKA